MKIKNKISSGFTIVELLVVILVIGILTAITVISYNGLQSKARDSSVLSDIDTMDALQTSYGLKNSTSGLAYYSGSGPSTTLGFTPSNGNVIDVVTNGTDYCIRGYNTNSTKNSISNASIKESTTGVCSSLAPSPQALADSPITSGWRQISAGWDESCGISYNYTVYCWGFGSSGRLGNNSSNNSSVPVAVSTSGVLSGKTVKSIAVGDGQVCVIASDNFSYCWGYGYFGQLGNGSTSGAQVPVAVSNSGVLSGKTIQQISTTYWHACAVASDSQAYCWGYNNYGQLGNSSTVQSSVPVAVSTTGVLSGKTIKSIASGGYHTCAIASDNQAYCWGYGYYGQLGNNTTTDSSVPVAVSTTGVLSGKTIKSIASGMNHTCVVASDNQVYCWGNGGNGQLGNNSGNIFNPVPVAVSMTGALSGKTIKSITTGGWYTCVIASDNQAYCWGDNPNGQLGNNSSTWSVVPVAVSTSGVLAGKTINSISAGVSFTCAVASDNKDYCWGDNGLGQFGNNSTTSSLVPVVSSTAP